MTEIVLTSSEIMLRVAVGVLSASLVAGVAYQLNTLSRSGALAAVTVGSMAVGGGWNFAVLLLVFFASASILTRYQARFKEARTTDIIAKGAARDAIQVFANGGVFAAALLIALLSAQPAAAFAAVGALAAATADTWATEIGSLSRRPPRSILTGQTVPTGTSGGVTALGGLAAAAGALFIGTIAWSGGMPSQIVPAAITGGLAGAAADSIVGASMQVRRWCKSCKAFTEREVHTCGNRTDQASGVSWLDNDMVNVLCTLVGAGIGALWVL